MEQTADADETAIYLDMPPNYMLEKKGVKEALLKNHWGRKDSSNSNSGSNCRWEKTTTSLILKRKTLSKSDAFLKDVIVRAQEKGWMTEKLMLEWLKVVWGRRPRAFLNQPSMLVLDTFKEHLTDSVKNQLHKMKTACCHPGWNDISDATNGRIH